MKNTKNIFITVLIILIFIIQCGGGSMDKKDAVFSSINDLTQAQLDALSQKKIYFGHMSVGTNIMDGIHDLLKEYPQLKVRVSETRDASDLTGPMFAHSAVGKNVDPRSKLEDFVRVMDSGLGNKVDIAFIKFCFVDIDSSSQVSELFVLYKTTMDNLKKKYPKTTFIHVTVPLTAVQVGWKVPIKRMLGKPIGGYADNIKRYHYNELLKKEYDGKEVVFDLATIESTLPDGNRETFTSDEKVYYSLAQAYTRDGGHLNEKGRKAVAEELLIILATISNK